MWVGVRVGACVCMPQVKFRGGSIDLERGESSRRTREGGKTGTTQLVFDRKVNVRHSA